MNSEELLDLSMAAQSGTAFSGDLYKVFLNTHDQKVLDYLLFVSEAMSYINNRYRRELISSLVKEADDGGSSI